MAIRYRITGPQSIERLDPLLRKIGADLKRDLTLAEDLKADDRLDFVWETACEQSWRSRHSTARVLNRLHNSDILEDKSNLAFLQLRMKRKVLETFVANGNEEVYKWASKRWEKSRDDPRHVRDWWVVKVSRGNGGRDVWVMNVHNYENVMQEFRSNDQLVIQKYVSPPLLWQGKKFHFRCYSLLWADMSAYVYEKSFILTAGSNFDTDPSAATTKHITNLSVNKRFPGHPGQVVCHIPSSYPNCFNQVLSIWKDVTVACRPFMEQQTCPTHFEFFGIDVVADTNGDCWLIEVNRLPGLESSKKNKEAEDEMYDEMMTGVLKMALSRLPECSHIFLDEKLPPEWVPVPVNESQEGRVKKDVPKVTPIGSCTDFPSDNDGSTDKISTWKNTFSWRAFTRRTENRRAIVLSSMWSVDTGPKFPICGIPGCTKLQDGTAVAKRCSRCKKQHYCSAEHQREHFEVHKYVCTPYKEPKQEVQEVNDVRIDKHVETNKETNEVRVSRCMFCGDLQTLRSEEDAIKHMRRCPALQEQLDGKDQFTIPKVLLKKVNQTRSPE